MLSDRSNLQEQGAGGRWYVAGGMWQVAGGTWHVVGSPSVWPTSPHLIVRMGWGKL